MFGPNTEFNVPRHLQSIVMELKSALTQCFSCCWQWLSQRTAIMQLDSLDEFKHHTSITRYISSCCSVDLKFSLVFFVLFFSSFVFSVVMRLHWERRGIMWHLIWNQTGEKETLLHQLHPAMHMEKARWQIHSTPSCPKICASCQAFKPAL